MKLPASRVRSWLRRPGDLSTASGRSAERGRRLLLAGAASVAATAISAAVALLMVPLTVKYLGPERYGLWVTLTSAVALVGLADLGVGNGLVGALSRATGTGDRLGAQRAVSSGLALLGASSAALALAFLLSRGHLPWARLLAASEPLARVEALPAATVLVCCALLASPLGVVSRVQVGFQDGYWASGSAALGGVLSLGAVALVVGTGGGLPLVALAFAGAPLLVTAAAGAWLFLRQRPWLRPQRRHLHRETARGLLRTGLLYFVLQCAAVLAFQSDNLIAAHLLGPRAVAEYAVSMRLFGLVPALAQTLLSPLWPAHGEAIARGDTAWVRSALRRSVAAALVASSGAALVLVAAGGAIVRVWASPELVPPPGLLLGLGAWVVLASVGEAISAFLNGAHVVRFQVLAASAMTATAIALKLVLAPRLGTAGLIWGTVLAYACCSLLPGLWVLRQVLRSLGARP